MDYKQAGVDIDAGCEAVRRIKDLARGTFTPGVMSDIGSFGGLFRLDLSRYEDPLLVSSADGVGTKLKVAFLAGVHDTVGADLVNHCVNDILVQGAEPLFFLDYLATSRLAPNVVAEVVGGIAGACRENGCALLGGETAELPGFYVDGEYDLAGFIVGIVDRAHLIDGSRIRPGDVIVGMLSSGLHTNGYSLARQILFDRLGLSVNAVVPELGGAVGEILLRPHRSYLPLVRPLLERRLINGMAHVTGGGITENLPRILPEGARACIDTGAWEIPGLFRFLGAKGDIPPREMFRVFNMGIGLLLVCSPEEVDTVRASLRRSGEPDAPVIGRITHGEPAVVYDSL